jgi:hypothetical protein
LSRGITDQLGKSLETRPFAVQRPATLQDRHRNPVRYIVGTVKFEARIKELVENLPDHRRTGDRPRPRRSVRAAGRPMASASQNS